MSDTLWVLCWLIPVVGAMLLEKWQLVKQHNAEVVRMHEAIDGSQERLSTALDRMEEEREHWRVERQKLLDRIQAPSFDHLKHHEVKTIRAQNGEKEPPKLVQL